MGGGAAIGGPAIAQKAKAKRPRWSGHSRRLAWIIGAVALVVIVAAGALAAIETKIFVPSHPTPTLAGLTLDQARAAAAKDHFTLHVEAAVTSIPIAAGSVVSQSPAAGTVLKQGAILNVVPSAGKPAVPVPSLTGLTCTTAATALTAAHLLSSCASARYDNSVPAGQIVGWSLGSSANPTHAPYGSTITLVPSAGHSPATVPSSISTSYTYAQAQAALSAVGLAATQATATSTTVASGDVISTSPAPGASAPYGSTVTVTVSTGPPDVDVPNVYQDSVAAAESAMQAAGLTISGAYGPNASSSSAIVLYTQPGQGQSVPEGSSVSLYTD